jgi:hypothetical protein
MADQMKREDFQVPRVLPSRHPPNGGRRTRWGGLGSNFFYRGFPPTFALVIPDFIGFLRFELRTSSAR